jgi:hypothetical protein
MDTRHYTRQSHHQEFQEQSRHLLLWVPWQSLHHPPSPSPLLLLLLLLRLLLPPVLCLRRRHPDRDPTNPTDHAPPPSVLRTPPLHSLLPRVPHTTRHRAQRCLRHQVPLLGHVPTRGTLRRVRVGHRRR